MNLLTRKELAKVLSVTAQTIKNYEAQGLPVKHLSKNNLRPKPRYDLVEVMVWIDADETKSFEVAK